MKDKYYTVKEVAKLLKISTRTVWRWIESGKIKPIKVNKIVRIGSGEIKKLTIGEKRNA